MSLSRAVGHRLAVPEHSALLVAMGSALEFAQGLTGYRFLSFADMAANTVGVVLGWLAAPPRLRNACAWVASKLSRAR
ncbi:MAG: hypothetical protein WAM94_04890 [Chromatiaceae bacterium]